MGSISDERVKSLLSRRSENLEAYTAKRNDITEKLSILDDYERSIIFPGQNPEFLGVQSSKVDDGVFRTLETLESKNISKKRDALFRMLNELEEKEYLMHRVFLCYETMASLFPLHYLVINKSMFKDNLSYSRIATELHKGPQTVAKMRDNLIHLIGMAAESGFSDEEICGADMDVMIDIAGKERIGIMMKIEACDRNV
jgi:hypothetical protein